ncbi:aKG-HExxH-type peptide beta-hydroxylase [Neolewinella litorea]|uniref:HEXXH motif domain-containing protein n=1 Tax=Neolewinella litorea TaxID=2562452 RepID=A0A4S4N5Z3_9BACT|nr:HEXXH motif-containing putative peptide modification protein [Neolewinella litorea]THH34534.1 hypothetical protein E4021_17700 [Neolewinella litorea]
MVHLEHADTATAIGFLKPKRLRHNRDTLVSICKERFQIQDLTYWQSIRLLQSPEILSEEEGEAPKEIWNLENGTFKKSLLAIMDQDHFQENWKFSNHEIGLYSESLKRALGLFQQLYPEIYEEFAETIHALLFAKRDSYDGGSVSSRVGMIWLSPKEHWTDVNWADNLLHEFVHNCLFLEDMVNTIFPYSASRMAEDDALVVSAIRRTKRGYDKSYHAAFVAYALVEFYEKLGRFDKAKSLLIPLFPSLNDMRQNLTFISDNGQKHLDDLIGSVLGKSRQLGLT